MRLAKQRAKHIRSINLILASDSYKVTHWSQFPEGLDTSVYYIESRGGKYDEVTVGGLRYVCEVLEASPITWEDYEEAEEILTPHLGGEYWNAKGWQAIIEEFDGKLPLEIKVAPEGLIVPTHNVIASIRSTDPKFDLNGRFAWVPGYLEGMTLQNAWYGSTVATHSRECLKVIHEYMVKTSDNMEKLPFMLHDFGFRGVSSNESSATGGYAHLLNSLGTDNLPALGLIRHMFPEHNDVGGYSIPAREHSTTTIYGTSLEGDKLAYTNSIKNFGSGIYACVMDSVDYKASIRMVAAELKRDIIAAGGTFVARPDSGNACDNILMALKEFGHTFGYTRNSKGYKVLHPSVAIIQGDGLSSPEDFRAILNWVEANGWSACNLAFGMGGGLLQQLHRDWLRFAEKMSAARINGEWRDVYKATPGKESKRGIQMLYRNGLTGKIFTDREGLRGMTAEEILFVGFLNGVCTHKQTLDNARELAARWK